MSKYNFFTNLYHAVDFLRWIHLEAIDQKIRVYAVQVARVVSDSPPFRSTLLNGREEVWGIFSVP